MRKEEKAREEKGRGEKERASTEEPARHRLMIERATRPRPTQLETTEILSESNPVVLEPASTLLPTDGHVEEHQNEDDEDTIFDKLFLSDQLLSKISPIMFISLFESIKKRAINAGSKCSSSVGRRRKLN